MKGFKIIMIVLGAIYIIAPVDIIPDVVPVLGFLDDGIVAILTVATAFNSIRAKVHSS